MPENFEIINRWVLWLIPLPVVLFLVLPALRLRSASLLMPSIEKASSYTGQKAKKASLVKRKSLLEVFVLTLVWLLLLCSLSSPQLVGKPELKVKTSRNFLVVADMSFSMAEKDWKIAGEKVSRWDAVTAVLHDFIDKRSGDRIGLILFASNAYVQVPFTPDLETVNTLLDEAAVGMAGQTTAIGKAVLRGIDLFENDTIDTKVMLLLTDGVDSGQGILPLDAAEMAKKDSIKIYTVGIGDPNSSNSDLDEKTLEQIAAITNANYYRAIDAKRLDEIYDELNDLEPIEYEEESYKPRTLLYPYPLAAALGIFALYLLFGSVLKLLSQIKKRKQDDA